MRIEHLQLRKRTRRLIASDLWSLASFSRFLVESVDKANKSQTIWRTPDSVLQCRVHNDILSRYYYILGR